MRGGTLTDPSLDRLPRPLRQGREEPRLARLNAPRAANPTAGSDTPARMLGKDERSAGFAFGASPPRSVASRRTAAAKLPVGSLVYLAFIGVVAVMTIGVFFGIGFFLLAQPKEELSAPSDSRDYAAGINPLRSGIVPRPSGRAPPAEGAAAPVSGETDLPRPSGAAAPLALPLSPSSAASELPVRQDSNLAQGPALGSTASDAPNAAPVPPGEARASIGPTRSANHDGRRDSETRAARHHKRRAHSRQQSSQPAAHPFPYGTQSLTPPRVGGIDPFPYPDWNR